MTETSESISLETVLAAICSEVVQAPAAGAQSVFQLNDARESKMAYDILVSFGLDVKLYQEAAHSRLYVNALTPEQTAKLPAALAHARNLKNLKMAIEAFCSDKSLHLDDFTFSFSNLSVDGKQINIYMKPAAQEMAAPAMPQVSAAAPNRPQQARGGQPVNRNNGPRVDEGFHSGSALAKKYPFQGNKDGNGDQQHMQNMMSRFFVKNIASNGLAILMMIVATLAILSLAIMSKGFLCPDLATKKSRAWYCQEPEEDPNVKPNPAAINDPTLR